MADSIDTARATELSGAALALEFKGHAARAAAKYALAVQAALELAQPDCLVVAFLRLACVNALTCVASAPAMDDQRMSAVQDLFMHQEAALETLQRRLAAGTLLAGCCRPYEVAWYKERTSQTSKLASGPPPSAAGKAEWATLIGFDALLRAANNILEEVVHMQGFSGERERQRCALVIAALDAITARCDEGAAAVAEAKGQPQLLWTTNQTTLVTSVREVVARRQLQPGTPTGAALAAAWARLQATGVLSAPLVSAHAMAFERELAAREAARAAAAAAPACRTCAFGGCGARELHAAHFKSCSACRGVAYCSKEHQVEDWPNHKAACKAARKNAGAAAEASR